MPSTIVGPCHLAIISVGDVFQQKNPQPLGLMRKKTTVAKRGEPAARCQRGDARLLELAARFF